MKHCISSRAKPSRLEQVRLQLYVWSSMGSTLVSSSEMCHRSEGYWFALSTLLFSALSSRLSQRLSELMCFKVAARFHHGRHHRVCAGWLYVELRRFTQHVWCDDVWVLPGIMWTPSLIQNKLFNNAEKPCGKLGA